MSPIPSRSPRRRQAALRSRKEKGLCVDCPNQALKEQVKCQACNDKAKARYRADRPARLQKLAEWRKKNPDYARKYNIQRKYGLTLDQWEKKFDEQGCRCAICGNENPGGKGYWHTDHDHETGQVRGILCHNCNLLLGHSLDRVSTLQKAIEYLERN